MRRPPGPAGTALLALLALGLAASGSPARAGEAAAPPPAATPQAGEKPPDRRGEMPQEKTEPKPQCEGEGCAGEEQQDPGPSEQTPSQTEKDLKTMFDPKTPKDQRTELAQRHSEVAEAAKRLAQAKTPLEQARARQDLKRELSSVIGDEKAERLLTETLGPGEVAMPRVGLPNYTASPAFPGTEAGPSTQEKPTPRNPPEGPPETYVRVAKKSGLESIPPPPPPGVAPGAPKAAPETPAQLNAEFDKGLKAIDFRGSTPEASLQAVRSLLQGNPEFRNLSPAAQQRLARQIVDNARNGSSPGMIDNLYTGARINEMLGRLLNERGASAMEGFQRMMTTYEDRMARVQERQAMLADIRKAAAAGADPFRLAEMRREVSLRYPDLGSASREGSKMSPQAMRAFAGQALERALVLGENPRTVPSAQQIDQADGGFCAPRVIEAQWLQHAGLTPEKYFGAVESLLTGGSVRMPGGDLLPAPRGVANPTPDRLVQTAFSQHYLGVAKHAIYGPDGVLTRALTQVTGVEHVAVAKSLTTTIGPWNGLNNAFGGPKTWVVSQGDFKAFFASVVARRADQGGAVVTFANGPMSHSVELYPGSEPGTYAAPADARPDAPLKTYEENDGAVFSVVVPITEVPPEIRPSYRRPRR